MLESGRQGVWLELLIVPGLGFGWRHVADRCEEATVVVPDRHARLHGLLDQLDLFLGSVAPAAVNAGDDLDARDGLRHRRAPGLEPRPSGLCRLSGSIGGRYNINFLSYRSFKTSVARRCK